MVTFETKGVCVRGIPRNRSHTNTREEQHHTTHDKNNITNDHTNVRGEPETGGGTARSSSTSIVEAKYARLLVIEDAILATKDEGG